MSRKWEEEVEGVLIRFRGNPNDDYLFFDIVGSDVQSVHMDNFFGRITNPKCLFASKEKLYRHIVLKHVRKYKKDALNDKYYEYWRLFSGKSK